MTVKELIVLLSAFPDDRLVVNWSEDNSWYMNAGKPVDVKIVKANKSHWYLHRSAIDGANKKTIRAVAL